MRRLLDAVFLSRADLDAFLIDNFSAVFREWEKADRTSTVNGAIKTLGTGKLFESLFAHYADLVAQHMDLVSPEPSWDAVRLLLELVAKEMPDAPAPPPGKDEPPTASLAELLQLPDPLLSKTQVMVIGITSGGKSTFINALLGRRLLPSDFRSSTCVVTHCRSGALDQLHIEYADATQPSEQIIGAEAITARLAELVTSRHNPQAGNTLHRVTLTAQTSELPGNLELVDTPGADADTQQAHRGLTLAAMASGYDVLLYMASIRHPPKPSDLQLLQQALATGKPVVFVLSKCDLERDSHEESKTLEESPPAPHSAPETREQKLVRYAKEILDEWQRLLQLEQSPSLLPHVKQLLQSAPLIVFSSEDVLDSSDPQAQVKRVHPILKQLSWASRMHHTLEIHRYGAEAATLVGRLCAQEPWQRQSGRRQALDSTRAVASLRYQASIEAAIADIMKVIPLIRPLVDGLQSLSKDVVKKVKDGDEVSKHRAVIDAVKLEANTKWLSFENFINTTKSSYYDCLPKRDNLDPINIVITISALNSARSAVNEYIIQSEKKFLDRGLEWIPFLNYKAPEYAINSQLFHRVIQQQIDEQISIIKGVLKTISEGYVEPLKRKLEEIRLEETKTKMSARSAAATAPLRPPSEAVLTGVRMALQALTAKATAALETPPPVERSEYTDVPPRSSAPPMGMVSPNSIAAMLTKLEHLRTEEGFWGAFQAALERPSAGRTVPKPTKVLLLGPRRDHATHLLSLLAHRLRDFRRLAEAVHPYPTQWLALKNAPKPRAHLPSLWLEALEQCRNRGLELTLAPADDQLERGIDWERILSDYDSIVVFFDMERVSAGCTDLESAVYYAALGKKNIAAKVCIACPDGALFAKSLQKLMTQVLTEMNARGVPMNIFLYEDYDVRYSSLMRIISGLLEPEAKKPSRKKYIVETWDSEGLSKDWPFNSDALQAIDEMVLQQSAAAEHLGKGKS